jgi:hypothetical protein
MVYLVARLWTDLLPRLTAVCSRVLQLQLIPKKIDRRCGSEATPDHPLAALLRKA